MTTSQKISELKQLIAKNLTPLITNDYVFLDLPYFPNIGDTLIWQGTLDFLATLPFKCLYSSSIENYKRPKINKEIIILLMGGGNFGDLWYRHQIFRKTILQSFPENKLIQLSQSIYFKNENIMKEDAEVFAQHKNLTMCFRDKYSLDIANRYFAFSTNLLVPDMAFNVEMNRWQRYIKPIIRGEILFLDRKDCEKNIDENYNIVPTIAEVRDWPTMEKQPFGIHIFFKLKFLLQKVSPRINNKISDIVFQCVLRKYYIRKGIEFISEYETIYTTRLHAGILAFMLGKTFTFFDNSYGKNRGVYETWLKDVETIKFTEK
jgi:pyruvyl transferase EpsO